MSLLEKDLQEAKKLLDSALYLIDTQLKIFNSQKGVRKFKAGWSREAHRDFIIIFSDALRGDEDPNKDTEQNVLETIDKMLNYISKYTYIST